MADLLWDDVEDLFDPETMGALPDVRVPDTTVRDWQALLDLVVERGWRHSYSVGEIPTTRPQAQEVLSRPADAECAQLRVWPADGVEAIFRFHTPDEIDFDVDLRELQGQERLNVLCGFFAAIGRRLGKPVLMDPEGDHGHPVLGFDVRADRVVRLTEPELHGWARPGSDR
ncbi:hypothetical protein DFP74_5061 [Nocardiopsis sp. Huas11]|uniref:hypothetical protein n=1 Tax=Nocardiopsis sp. Huas11 TaxID=2183912 RepID=UPI000EAF135A|nr:hypothetical protein [Nocardiopsis sp. Huas11]RKS09326.1 hypothetical protein DFP74_5061 [Nocardiopsis sp. Huas11]